MDERDLDLLGASDPQMWREQIRHGYIRLHLLYGLEETRVFDALRRAGVEGATAAALAEECNVDRQIVEGALDYLAFSDVVIDKRADRYALTARGREWLGADATLNMTHMMAAYAPLLDQLIAALRRKKRYGKDFKRDGALLAFASAKGARFTYPWIISEMRALGVEVVADLGCGAAGLLIEFCTLDPTLRGVGIDIDADAVETARNNVRAHGLTDRVRIIRGDLTNPAEFAHEISGALAFNALGVIHELLVDGEEAVLRLFRQFRELFPGRYLFLGEIDRTTDAGWATIPLKDRIKKLHYQHVMHTMSFQGEPLPRARWLALFERAGVTVVKVKPFFVDEFVLRL